MNKISAVCFGEILWDQLGSEMNPGGAPMNVAYHLKQFDVGSSIISQVGKDSLGKKIMNIMNNWKIDTSCCSYHTTMPTGIAKGTMDDQFEVHYDIQKPAAWDFISTTEASIKMVEEADLFIHGSLAARNEQSKDTLLNLLEKAQYKVFDINLRAPFYDQKTIKLLLEKADLLKLNEAELTMLTTWFAPFQLSETESIEFLQNTYSVSEIVLTRGADGASYFTNGQVVHANGLTVEVMDTVGSGDAFLSGFLAQKMKNIEISKAMAMATTLAGFVTTQKGACPAYDVTEMEKLTHKK